MPHDSRHSGSSGDDLGSTDEVKVFKDEGDREDDKISSENLLVEEKSSLIDLTESEEKGGKPTTTRHEHCPSFSKLDAHAASAGFNMGYIVAPYTYGNGAAAGLPVSMANKMGLSPFFCNNPDPLSTPPPAHCGIPPYQLDSKAIGLTRPALYSFPTGQYPYPMLSPDISQIASWHTPSVYSAATSFRNPYPTSLPINSTLPGNFPFRFNPNLLHTVHSSPQHVLSSQAGIMSNSGVKQECSQEAPSQRYRPSEGKSKSMSQSNSAKESEADKKKNHIKKPLNAFMLYMKEMRAKVVAECTLKESAAINQILGRRWHELSREEQSKYYEKARQERQLHMELYPGWSARDNYGYVSKKKKRKKDRSPADSSGNNMKKCRARFGLEQQNQWCKPCRRKKKCIRYMEAGGGGGSSSSGGFAKDEFNDLDDDQLSDDSSDSGDDTIKHHDDDSESLNQSINSPASLSGQLSLKSPSSSLPSPLSALPSSTSALISSISSTLSTTTTTAASNMEHKHQTAAVPPPPPPHLHPQQFHVLNPHHLNQTDDFVTTYQSLLQRQNHHNLLSHQKTQHHQQQQAPHQPQLHPHQQKAISAASSPSRSFVGVGSMPINPSASSNSFGSSQALLDRPLMRSIMNTSPIVRLNEQSPKAIPRSGKSANEEHDRLQEAGFKYCTDPLLKPQPSSSEPSSSSSSLSSTPATSSSTSTASSKRSSSHQISSGFATLHSSSDVFHDKLPILRSPIGANPRDINNPLNISQLTNRSDFSLHQSSCFPLTGGSSSVSLNIPPPPQPTTNNGDVGKHMLSNITIKDEVVPALEQRLPPSAKDRDQQ